MSMLELRAEIERLPLAWPFRIASYEFNSIDVLVVRQLRAGRHAHQRGEHAGLRVDEQRLLLDALVLGLFPRLVGYIDKHGR